MSRILTCVAALLLALAFLGSAAGCRRSSAPANVLLVVIDTLRADRLDPAGAPRLSPNLDALAAGATVFRRAYSPTSWTNPSIAALFTGQPPRTFQPGAERFIDPQQDTLAEVLRRAGYATAGIVANPVLGPHLGFGDGFEMYEGLAGWTHGLERRPKADARRVTDSGLAWISQQRVGGGPWLLYLHYMDPHWPYEPDMEQLRRIWKGDLPDAAAVQEINRQVRERKYTTATLALARHLYDAAVATVDAEIGRLLETLQASGALERTVVVVTADHGEELGDHGDVLHARTLYEEVLRVPLILRAPGVSARQILEPVQITDLGRTLLDAAGLGAVAFPGQPLLASPPATALRAELHPGPWSAHSAAVIDGSVKLITTAGQQMQLFDLASDPAERHDLSALQPQLVRRLRDLLPTDATGRKQAAAVPTPPDPAIQERLRALGYDF